MASTALYLMFNAWSEANYKIGNSNSPGRRQAEVTFSYEVDPKIITDVWFTTKEAAHRAELYWHKYFADQRTDDHGGREWFSLTRDNVSTFSEWAAKGKSQSEMRHWLYGVGATRRQQDEYNNGLLLQIPRHLKPPSIDVWTSSDSKDSWHLRTSTKVLDIGRPSVRTFRTSKGPTAVTRR